MLENSIKTIGNNHLNSFFDTYYQAPKSSRRHFLKSAAGASTIVALPALSLTEKDKKSLAELAKTDPWLTLEATLLHLLPESQTGSSSGPSAKDINALAYLHQVITVQPTAQDEKDFIIKGVGWLNGFAQSEHGKPFGQLSFNEKESTLRGISNSSAGENWLTTLLAYLFEAMLAPPAYGGNTNGLGWQWLDHQAGFPLPKVGQRYFELPPRGRAKNEIAIQDISSIPTNAKQNNNRLASISSLKTPPVKRTNKA